MLYLNCAEWQAAYFAARKYFDKKNQPIEVTTISQFNAEIDYQLVYLMVLEPEAENPEARLFKSVEDVRRELSPNEVRNFVDEHELFMAQEVEQWVLGKVDPHLGQIARILNVDETTDADAIVELVRQAVEGSE